MRFKLTLALALLVALPFAYTPPAHAGGIVKKCDESSLRAALTGGGTVTFRCSGTITLAATITISSDTTIDGTGRNVTISGGGAIQIFSVSSGVKFNLNKLTIANGSSVGGGGGIDNFGTLTVNNSIFSSNSASAHGGGIHTAGTLTVTNSTFSGNSAQEGGAISSVPNGSAVTVSGSTFSGNSTSGEGGAISNGGGTLTVTNSTFSGNGASGGGGGAINNDYGGTLIVTNSTFSRNSVSGGGGGAINSCCAFSTTFQNTIVANSIGDTNCSLSGATVIDGGGNLSWPDTSCPGINQDPLLDPNGLQNNGGPTQTIALLGGSPAIDAAVVAKCPATDQRGVPRFDDSHCDIGAYETANTFISSLGVIPNISNPIVGIEGGGFGTLPSSYVVPAKHITTPYFRFKDATVGWEAGYSGDLCTVSIYSWSSSAIAVTVNAGDNLLCPTPNIGDRIEIDVCNPETPSCTPGSPSTGEAQAFENVTGQLTFTLSIPKQGMGQSLGGFSVGFLPDDLKTITSGIVTNLNQQGFTVSDKDIGYAMITNHTQLRESVAELDFLIGLPSIAISAFDFVQTVDEFPEAFPLSLVQLYLEQTQPSPTPAVVDAVINVSDAETAYKNAQVGSCVALRVGLPEYLITREIASDQELQVTISNLGQMPPISLSMPVSYRVVSPPGPGSLTCTAETGTAFLEVTRTSPATVKISLVSP